MITNRMTIKGDVWRGDWGLPSIDSDSISMMALIKFTGVELIVNKSCQPLKKLPAFHIEDHLVTGFADLCFRLKDKGIDIDSNLSPSQNGELYAYECLLRQTMYPVLLYFWFVEKENYNKFTKVWFGKRIPFPLNFYFPAQYAKNAAITIQHIWGAVEDSDLEEHVLREADGVLCVLSNRLGEANFLYGAQPSSLDALVYGYLAPIIHIPFVNTRLSNLLSERPNLRRYVERISQLYFPGDMKEYEECKKHEAKKKLNDLTDEFPHSLRNKIFAAAFASSTMLIYAVSTGIIKVSLKSKDFI